MKKMPPSDQTYNPYRGHGKLSTLALSPCTPSLQSLYWVKVVLPLLFAVLVSHHPLMVVAVKITIVKHDINSQLKTYSGIDGTLSSVGEHEFTINPNDLEQFLLADEMARRVENEVVLFFDQMQDGQQLLQRFFTTIVPVHVDARDPLNNHYYAHLEHQPSFTSDDAVCVRVVTQGHVRASPPGVYHGSFIMHSKPSPDIPGKSQIKTSSPGPFLHWGAALKAANFIAQRGIPHLGKFSVNCDGANKPNSCSSPLAKYCCKVELEAIKEPMVVVKTEETD